MQTRCPFHLCSYTTANWRNLACCCWRTWTWQPTGRPIEPVNWQIRLTAVRERLCSEMTTRRKWSAKMVQGENRRRWQISDSPAVAAPKQKYWPVPMRWMKSELCRSVADASSQLDRAVLANYRSQYWNTFVLILEGCWTTARPADTWIRTPQDRSGNGVHIQNWTTENQSRIFESTWKN